MKIFTPISLGECSLQNRIVRSATHEYFENPDSTFSAQQLEILEQLAKSDIGLIITGHMYISKQGQASSLQNGVYHDRFLPGMSSVAEHVHKHGAKIAAQINHAGAKAIADDPVGSSALELVEGRKAREITVEEIEQVRADFVLAALRVQAAGFDGVQIHLAHHYLLSEFVTPSLNHRNDCYGGSVENRFRLPAQIISDVVAATGRKFPVLVKINSNVPEEDDAYEQELLYMLREMKRLGVAAVELSGYDFAARKGENYYLDRAARLRKEVDLPMILVGGIQSLAGMEKVMEAGIDMAALSRPLICEPDLIVRLKKGQETCLCTHCNRCHKLPLEEGIRCVRHRKA